MSGRKAQIATSSIKEYATLVAELKDRIRSAQVRATRSVNRELIMLYWDIGKAIVERQKRLGWGKSVVEKLARDLRVEFPNQTGFSPQNLWFMRKLYEEVSGHPNLLRHVRELPWGVNITVLTKVKDNREREYYLRAARQYGWTRTILTHQIETALYRREVKTKKTHNFRRLLPARQARAADGMMKDPYVFDFITLEPDAREHELERALLFQLRRFLIELGKGFAFVGSQYRLQVGKEEFFLDLLFYHLGLRRYIVIDLKTVPFKPEFAGKMNFYLTAVDEQLRHTDDGTSVGIILCKDKDDVVVEFALRDVHKPLGVARYQMTTKLPKQLSAALPSVSELKRELKKVQA
jgi:predicted nuclease of restriction endonuclease-like (RecB) superfamily